jgi:hypothetical protein
LKLKHLNTEKIKNRNPYAWTLFDACAIKYMIYLLKNNNIIKITILSVKKMKNE